MRKTNAALTKTAPLELSWTPIRIGEQFCAPACGRGCTLKEYQRAAKSAEALAKRLGPGWHPEIWENCGWHAKAVDETGLWKVHISPATIGGYSAFLGEGKIGGRYTEHGRTPELAIQRTRTKALDEYNAIAKLLAAPVRA